MKCLETRKLEHGLKWRRYRTEDGLIVKTIEVPEPVWKSMVGQGGKMRSRLKESLSTLAKKARKQEAILKLRDGWKPIAVAHEMGVSVRSVYAWWAADQK